MSGIHMLEKSCTIEIGHLAVGAWVSASIDVCLDITCRYNCPLDTFLCYSDTLCTLLSVTVGYRNCDDLLARGLHFRLLQRCTELSISHLLTRKHLDSAFRTFRWAICARTCNPLKTALTEDGFTLTMFEYKVGSWYLLTDYTLEVFAVNESGRISHLSLKKYCTIMFI